jgi:hypothetical protein
MSVLLEDRPPVAVASESRVTVAAWRLRAVLDGAAVAAGTDATLPALCCVQVDTVDGELRAVGTDRYRLAIVTGQTDGVDGVPVSGLMVSAVDVRAVVRMLPRARAPRGAAPVAVLTVGDGRWRVDFDGASVSGRDMSGECSFPKWQSLVPDVDACTYYGPVCFSPVFLADMGKLPAPRGGANSGVRYVGAVGAGKPTLWEHPGADGVGWRYLLMPIKSA